MPISISANGIGDGWGELLEALLNTEQKVSPRGMPIREQRNVTLCIKNARNNILLCSQRKLNYRFMVAEWLWIWFGHHDVPSIARYNPKIAEFSNDGLTFAGAYGPHIGSQWNRVVEQLRIDPDTRQAIIQIFDPSALSTKDVACTLALQFMIRDQQLHTTAYMRSSDVWLGLPYDTFTFAMLGNIMAAQCEVEVGALTFHLGSSHLYERDAPAASLVLMANEATTLASPVLPGMPPFILDRVLCSPIMWAPHGVPFTPTPWAFYCDALAAPNSIIALTCLRGALDATTAIQ